MVAATSSNFERYKYSELYLVYACKNVLSYVLGMPDVAWMSMKANKWLYSTPTKQAIH
jgi:hypothetical protein